MRRQGIITIILVGLILVTIGVVTIIINYENMPNNSTVNMTTTQNNNTTNNTNNTTIQEHENKTTTSTSTNTKTSQNKKKQKQQQSSNSELFSPEDIDDRVGPNCPPPPDYTYDINNIEFE